MILNVAGLGIVSRIGGTSDIEKRLSGDLIEPELNGAGPHLDITFPGDSHFPEKLVRRMSHFARLSLLSASLSMRDLGGPAPAASGKTMGIIQGSVYGPIISGIQALDDLIDFGDSQLSPTNFSGSVFNTSSTCISLAYGIQGRTLSHTGGQDTLYNSLITADLWLESGEADYVIVGIGDEYTSYFDGMPGAAGHAGVLFADTEGWTTFILTGGGKGRKYGRIELSVMKELKYSENKNNIYSVWHKDLKPEIFSAHAGGNSACSPAGLRGSYPCGQGFDLALALICHKMKRFPVNKEGGGYRNVSLSQGSAVDCYGIAENGGIFHFGVSDA
ncbi:MAG: beta-ketoacyl synthase chain length factor [Brevinematales bacterium]|jgi:hypothetical protein